MSTSIAFKQQQQDPKSGHVGTLTKEQFALLRKCYAAMYAIQSANDGETSRLRNDESKNKPKNGIKLNNDKYNESEECMSAMKIYSPEALRQATWLLTGADDPDVLLLRFLRARKWDVDNAIAMLIATLKWRLQFDVRAIVEDGELGMERYFDGKGVKGLKTQFTCGKSFVRGTDYEGRPIVYINVKAHKKSDQNFEILQRFTVYVMETVRLMIEPPVETGCLVFNMEGFSLANMDLQYVKFMIQCFEAYYPESLGILIIHKAPWVFPQVWKVISPLLDPVVASKITFTKTEQELMNLIPPEHLIEGLGGKDKWKYEYVHPTDDENYKMKDKIKKKELMEIRTNLENEFEFITRKLIEGPDNDQIIKERDQLKLKLRRAQLDLDPYTRPKTYYHRIGVLDDERNVNWVYNN
ncbi:15014_t:CDS:2 [Funneliformis mosseae]|uniref:15014_t:CDS:1 n=1 Tax=Funneliformis mosseae TaxID=27381 RepID=A0A9N8VC78_FUNMO|nr:15014_t:CDS:2 [Funneliformis mosseae]